MQDYLRMPLMLKEILFSFLVLLVIADSITAQESSEWYNPEVYEIISGVSIGTSSLSILTPQRQIQLNTTTNLGSRLTLNGTYGRYTGWGSIDEYRGYRLRAYLAYHFPYIENGTMYIGAGLQYRSESMTQDEVFSRFDGVYFEEIIYRERVQNFGVPLVFGALVHIGGRFYADLLGGVVVYEEFTRRNVGVPADAQLLSFADGTFILSDEVVVVNIKLLYKLFKSGSKETN